MEEGGLGEGKFRYSVKSTVALKRETLVSFSVVKSVQADSDGISAAGYRLGDAGRVFSLPCASASSPTEMRTTTP